MTSFKTLRVLLDDIENLDSRCRDAGLCLRTLLADHDPQPKQSTKPQPASSSSKFPGALFLKGKSGYSCSPEQEQWIRSQYPARSMAWMAAAAGISTGGMKSLFRKLKISVVRRNNHGIYTTRPSTRVTATDVVLEIIKSHSAKGRIARTDVRRWAKRQRLNASQVGQVLRGLQERKQITIDGDLICTP